MSKRMYGKSFDGGEVINSHAYKPPAPLSPVERDRKSQERKVRNIELEFSSRVRDLELLGMPREKAQRVAQVAMGLFPN
jgi:hypothetical protein